MDDKTSITSPELSENLDDSENVSSNPTDNPSFRDIVNAGVSRRQVLKGSLAAAAAGFLVPAPAMAFGPGGRFGRGGPNQTLVGFKPLSTDVAVAAGGKTVTISPDYEYQVLIPWGSPIDPALGVPEYDGDPDTRPTAEDQEQLVGIGHDGMFFYPSNLPKVLQMEARRGERLPAKARTAMLDSRAGMLCVNHEFGRNSHVLGKDLPENKEDVRLSQAAHGVSVVAIASNRWGDWNAISSPNSRRITVNTPMAFSGPAADSDLLKNTANNPYLGTANNCGSGMTPWGTYVTCEENFNGYFGSNTDTVGGFDQLQDESYVRYGFSKNGFGYGWHLYDDRFDLSNEDYKNEPNRFGWCVEIDPFDGTKKPVKRTALGRFKHEAIAIKELADGRIAAYMGDDQRGDYCYKYESNRPWRETIAAGDSPLDDGKLYVAVFDGDIELDKGDGKGTGKWVELTFTDSRISGVGLDTQDKVLVYTRLAADAVGATQMDRPEWTTIGTEGEVYWTLTNNTGKDQLATKDGALFVNEVNPIFNHQDGHIIRTEDTSSTSFEWKVFILARNTRPTDPETDSFDGDDNPVDFEYARYQTPADGGANTFTDPDAAWADPYGRLFIGTDGGQPVGLQDQLVVFDIQTGEYKRLLMGVSGDEITGITTTPDQKTLFTNTQHPGNGNPTATNFPAPQGSGKIPRDCTLVVVRKNNGIVGS
ncbi:PhoX family protein [Thioalkalivibrio sp.]|uniref:PhoX family protein n=1 Tax=Thioalkalivibrio sp. TaxID=2093813 RepID=UPI00356551DA